MSKKFKLNNYRSRHGLSTFRRQQGLSLIELMISLVVGLILVAAVSNMYVSNLRSARFVEGLQSIQENGRYAVSVLQRGLRLAGFSPLEGSAGQIEAFKFNDIAAGTLAIRSYQGFDCNGMATDTSDGLAVNTYALDTTKNELTCTGNQVGSSAMPIVEGVERFRVLYGVDEDGDPDTCEPQRYIPFDSTLESSDVVALRFALLINSGQQIRTRQRSETFVLLDETFVGPNDRLVREVFSGTVLLRNNISCSNI